MPRERKHITVFEHQIIKLNQTIDGVLFTEAKLKALQSFSGDKGVPYFSLIHNGVKFNEHVGVIQVGETLIEVLPKADKHSALKGEKDKWREVLIGMIRAVGLFEIQAPSSSQLKLKPNSILDLYFELFINKAEYLLHNGLIKKYRKKEGNVFALKGRILFEKNIQQNLNHQERFFVEHTTYDFEHLLHFILYKTICLLKAINTNSSLQSRIGALLLHFPEMPDMKVTEETFQKINFNRKTESYRKAIEIAKLLLLHYHPDISRGRNNVLALMFDMNKLWENFVFVSLKKHKPTNTSITAQTSKYFWKQENNSRTSIRPDIVINKGDKNNCVVLDTKWKNIFSNNPSPDDLRQMYIYHDYYEAKKVALIYPGENLDPVKGKFLDKESGQQLEMECSVITLPVENIIRDWQKNIYNKIDSWIKLN